MILIKEHFKELIFKNNIKLKKIKRKGHLIEGMEWCHYVLSRDRCRTRGKMQKDESTEV
jgi:hypothetical protein